MRIERTGPVEKLTPRVERFLADALGGVAMDDVQSAERTRIDFSCLRGLLAIEMKSLEGDPSERTNNFVDTLRNREDFPTFFGAVPLEAALQNMEEPERLRRAAMDRLARAVVTHMKKANDQLAQHERDFPRSHRLNVMLLVNEDHPEYDLQSIGWICMRELAKEDERGPRYSKIDAVIYFTERHGKAVDQLMAFPIASIHNRSVDAAPWKEALLGHIVGAWAKWNGRPLFAATDCEVADFEAVEHIPDVMPKHEAWRLAYRRNPYFRHLTEEQLRDEFDEVMLITTLWGLKGSPIKFDLNSSMIAIERFTHLQVEMHHRALPMERFSYEFKRQLAAARRLKLPKSALDWLHDLERRRDR